MSKTISLVVLLLLAQLLLLGCGAKPLALKERFVIPLPPEEPRLEWLGTYSSEDDFPKTDTQIISEKMLGKPPLTYFTGPYGIAADGPLVFISDIWQKRIIVYDLERWTVSPFFKDSQPSPLQRPYGMAIDSRKRLYVADAELNQVLVFDFNARLLQSFGSADQLKGPQYICLDEPRQRLLVSDSLGKKILIYGLDGQLLQTITDPEDRLFNPQGVAVAPNGNIYVGDGLGAKVFVFSPEGKVLKFFGTRLDTVTGMEFPKGLFFDSEGHLWLTDNRKRSLRAFDQEGQLLLSVEGPVAHKLGFGAPVALYITPDDQVFVTDLMARRFSHWRYLSKANLERFPLGAAKK